MPARKMAKRHVPAVLANLDKQRLKFYAAEHYSLSPEILNLNKPEMLIAVSEHMLRPRQSHLPRLGGGPRGG